MSTLRGIMMKICQPKFILRIDPSNARTLKSTLRVTWVRPEKLPTVHPKNTGDKSPMVKFPKNTLIKAFENSEELKTGNENVRKIFELEMNNKVNRLDKYVTETADHVRRHQYDNTTHEVYIAHLTAKIRFLQDYMAANPRDKKNKLRLYLLVDRRKKQLKHLRRWDYPRFEWLLEKLDIVYKPDPDVFEQVTRKKSLTQLTTIHCEEIKEKKIAEFRKKMDAAKVPFLEKKLESLRKIKQQEGEFQLESTVSDEEISDCEARLAKARLEAPILEKRNYERTIDPYTLEKFDPVQLYSAEGRVPNKAEDAGSTL